MKTAAILGASGYGGGELIRFLDAHTDFEVGFLGAHSKAGLPLSTVHPHLSGGDRMLAPFEPASVDGIDVAFLALPHGSSAGPAMQLIEMGITVIDLGSDFRLDTPQRYRTAYGTDHPFPEELGAWAYGIPELFRDQVADSDRIAAPGCYPTSSVLPIAPLVAAGLASPSGIIVDSMTGVSGNRTPALEWTSPPDRDETPRERLGPVPGTGRGAPASSCDDQLCVTFPAIRSKCPLVP